MHLSCYEIVPSARVGSELGERIVDELSLTFDVRTRSRGKAVSASGKEIAWFLEQGQFLRDFDVLLDGLGNGIRIVADKEAVSVVTANDTYMLMRVAYHLGNRHIPLHILPTSLRFQPDHVLEEMVLQLGAAVTRDALPFQPEAGAYHSHGNGEAEHSHSHSHSHSHA